MEKNTNEPNYYVVFRSMWYYSNISLHKDEVMVLTEITELNSSVVSSWNAGEFWSLFEFCVPDLSFGISNMENCNRMSVVITLANCCIK